MHNPASRNPRPSPLAPRPFEGGVALVITLILLSVITFMAVTFLVLSRNEKGSVTTQTDLTIARLAADAALQRAQAELLAPIMAWTNENNYGLLVSTNYISSGGYTNNGSSFLNVSYTYPNGAPLSQADALQNLTNLFFNPRPPVFITTNADTKYPLDFRFFVNLNRNTTNGNPRFDPTGLLPVIGANGLPITDLNGNIVSNFLVGDPQWIGGLQRPEFNHSATNAFIYRYAYLAVPAGQTLDINTIHNYAREGARDDMSRGDAFLRNQGVLTAEINLAAFLVDLNTNFWPLLTSYDYKYLDLNAYNSGTAFDDALALLRYRYNSSHPNLASASQLFANTAKGFTTDFVDDYSAGPLMTGTWWPPAGWPPNDRDSSRTNLPWSGADNPNHFFTTQDLFDQSKTRPPGLPPKAPSFTDRLLTAGTNNSSYDRYTFYRLLSQLGTDSAPEPGGKMNLNYCNVDANGYVVPNMETNSSPWFPGQFFTNALIRLLADAGYTVGNPNSTTNLLVTNYVGGILVTNLHIPIYVPIGPTNFYSASVHRLAQIAANLYDATTNRADLTAGSPTPYPYLPSVFRPLFRRSASGQVFIVGYREALDDIVASANPRIGPQFVVLPDGSSSIPLYSKPFDPSERFEPMVAGIPLVIGARKGLPNFNEFSMQTEVQVERKFQFSRPNTNALVNQTNEMYVVGITNVFGVEAWNSYSNTYPRSLEIRVWPDFSLSLTDDKPGRALNDPVRSPGRGVTNYQPGATVMTLNFPANAWTGYSQASDTTSGTGPSFRIPLLTNNLFLAISTFWKGGPDHFIPVTGTYQAVTPPFYLPQWRINMQARLRFAVVDVGVTPKRIVDFGNLAAALPEPGSCCANTNGLDLTGALAVAGTFDCSSCYATNVPYYYGSNNACLWSTNRWPSASDERLPTFGMRNQIGVCLGLIAVGSATFRRDFPAGLGVSGDTGAVDFFRAQFPGFSPIYFPRITFPKVLTFAAPFQPYRSIYLVNTWQAHDPLVHYTVGDLKDLSQPTIQLDFTKTAVDANLGKVNARYEPWGIPTSGNPGYSGIAGYDRTFKDPVPKNIGSSDDWDFPMNKFPNAGWLGRVHRGSPWQTIYLKAGGLNVNSWTNWTGNGQIITNWGQFGTNVVLMPNAILTNVFRPPLLLSTNGPITFTNGLPVYDAYFTQPTNDWHILDLFTASLGANATRGQLSVNQTNLAAWSAVLSGVIVLTNAVDAYGNLPVDAYGSPRLTPLVIQPAGAYDPAAPPPVARIVAAVNAFRATNNVRQVFSHLGDLLAVPELTVASPFLNTNVNVNLANPYTLSDAAYERLPQQILGLLKADTVPRFVIYSYGQTLKPAPHSIYLGNLGSGVYRGLCTNYQITAEVATRAVVRFEGIQPYGSSASPAITNLHPVIESFNVLPPD